MAEHRADISPANLVALLPVLVPINHLKQIGVCISSGESLVDLLLYEVSLDKTLLVQSQPKLLRLMTKHYRKEFR